MKKNRLILILALALVLCGCIFGLFACGEEEKIDLTSNEIQTVAPAETEKMFAENTKTDVLVNSCIDVEDYIVKHTGSLDRAVQFKFTDKKGVDQSVTVRGATYYPTISGVYTLVYTEQFKDRIVRDSMKITVFSETPEIKISNLPLFYSKGRTVNFRLLLNNANPFCDVSNDYKMESVTYYQMNVDLEETKKEGTEKVTTFTNETKYTFEEYGTYIFTFSVEFDGLTGYSNFRVEVLEGNQGNDDTLLVPKTEENDEGEEVVVGTQYASDKAQVKDNVVRLIQSEYDSASYLVLEEDYHDTDVLRVEFKGKNAPNIGLLTIPNYDENNPYGLISGKGYTLSFEHTYTNMFSIWGPGDRGSGRFGGNNMHNGNSVTGYFGRVNFDDDKYYLVETNLETASRDEMLSVFHLNIYEIEKYGTPEQSYKNVYFAEVPAGSSKEGKIEKGKIVFYSSAKEDVTFKYYKPTGRVKNIAINGDTVTWDAVDGASYLVSVNGIDYTKQTANSFYYPNFIENLTPLFVKVLVDDGFTNLEDGTPKMSWTVTTDAGIIRSGKNLVDGPAIFNRYVAPESEAYTGTDIEVSEGTGELTQDVGLTVPHANVSVPFVGIDKQTYMVTKDSYESGTYVAMEFIGNKMPSFILFGVNDIGTGLDEADGVGVDMDYYVFGARSYYKANKDAEVVFGEMLHNKLTRGYFKSYATDATFSNDDDFKFAAITKYVLVIGAVQDGADVKINYYIYAQTGIDAYSLIEEKIIVAANATLNEGKIAVRSTVKVGGQVSEFKVYTPDTLANLNVMLDDVYGITCQEIVDVTKVFASKGSEILKNTDGSYTFNMPLSIEYNWVATKQAYGSGTYIMTEFVGTALPGNIIFGVNNVNDPLTIKEVVSYNGQYTWNGVGLYSDHWYQPYLYSKKAGADATYTAVVGKFTRGTDPGYLATSDVRVMITGVENDGANVKVTNTIYTKNGTTLTLFDNQTYTVNGYNVSEGSIVLSSSCCFGQATQGLKLWTIGTKTDVETKLNSVYTINA